MCSICGSSGSKAGHFSVLMNLLLSVANTHWGKQWQRAGKSSIPTAMPAGASKQQRECVGVAGWADHHNRYPMPYDSPMCRALIGPWATASLFMMIQGVKSWVK